MGNKDEHISVSQTIGGNNYANMNVAGGNVNAVNIVSQGNNEDLLKTIDYLKNFVMTQDIEKEEKESALDDLDTIEEQISNNNPKKIKIRKAYDGFKAFISKLPQAIATGTLIASKLEELHSKLQPLIGI